MPTLVLPFPAINPVLVQWGPLAIRWYALAYIAGLIVGWAADSPGRRGRPVWGGAPRPSAESIDDLLVYCALRRRRRRPARQRAVLRSAILFRPSARNLQSLGRRHGFSRRPDRRLRRRPFVRPSLSRADADRSRSLFAGRADRHLLWPHRQFHSARALGPPDRRSLGYHLSGTGRIAPSSEPDLRGASRRASVFCDPSWRSRDGAPCAGRASSPARSASSTERRASSANFSASPIQDSRISDAA